MKVREIQTNLTEVLLARFGHDERSPGLHASEIWEDLNKAITKTQRTSPISSAGLAEFGSIGFLWERVLEKVLASIMLESDTEGRYIRPGEQIMDGVATTPDYCDLDFDGDQTWAIGVEEWKVRWCSYRKADDLEKNFWKMIVQQKVYCRALKCNQSRLRMLFIVGDWRGDITPKLRQFELEFTDRELEENWQMLMGHARRRGMVK